jgi:hypothetical protein
VSFGSANLVAGPSVTRTGPAGGSGNLQGAHFVTASSATSIGDTQHFPTNPITGTAKVEQSGTLGLRVPAGHVSKVVDNLNSLAGANGGYVTSSTVGSNGITTSGLQTGSITLEVPQAKFSAVLNAAKREGTVESVSTKTIDDTGKYVNLQSQITALNASRQQYLTIMTHADSIGDILSVQAQLNSIETQLQKLQGQVQLLDSQTAYATLHVSVSEAPSKSKHASTKDSGLVSAIKGSVHGFVRAVEETVRLIGPVLFGLLALFFLLGIARVARRYLRRRAL